MATTYTYAQGAWLSDAVMLADLDVDGVLTGEQYETLKSKYKAKIDKLIEYFDPTLTWLPYIGEVYGIDGVTDTDPADFREWFKSGADGLFDGAFIEAWNETCREYGIDE